MRIQIQLQQLEKNFRVEQGNGQAQGAVEGLSSLRSTSTRTWTGEGARPYIVCGFSQRQIQMQFLGGQGPRAQPDTQLLQ